MILLYLAQSFASCRLICNPSRWLGNDFWSLGTGTTLLTERRLQPLRIWRVARQRYLGDAGELTYRSLCLVTPYAIDLPGDHNPRVATRSARNAQVSSVLLAYPRLGLWSPATLPPAPRPQQRCSMFPRLSSWPPTPRLGVSPQLPDGRASRRRWVPPVDAWR